MGRLRFLRGKPAILSFNYTIMKPLDTLHTISVISVPSMKLNTIRSSA